MENITRTTPASASSLSYLANKECQDFTKLHLDGFVKGSDEYLIKLDSLARLGDVARRVTYDMFKAINKDAPHNSYRDRMASLGLWPKSGLKLKPVNPKECQARGGEYKTRALTFESLRKYALADKKAVELAALDLAARQQGFASYEEQQAAIVATVTPVPENVPAIATEGKTNIDLAASLASARDLIRKLALGGLNEDDTDAIVSDLSSILDSIQAIA